MLKERLTIEYGSPLADEPTRFAFDGLIQADKEGEVDRFADPPRRRHEERWPDVRFTDIKTYVARNEAG